MIRLFLTLALLLPLAADATINAASFQREVRASADGGRYSQYPAGDKTLIPPDRKVYFTGTFETTRSSDGKRVLQAKESVNDGFLVLTMKSIAGTCDSESFSYGGNADGDSPAVDSYVVADGATIGGDTGVASRSGSGFYKASLVYDRSYKGITNSDTKCNDPTSPDSARMALYMSDTPHRIDYDSEVWFGFSVYIPSTWEIETGVTGNRSEAAILEIPVGPTTGGGTTASNSPLTLSLRTASGTNYTSWILKTNDSATTINSNNDTTMTETALGTGSIVAQGDVGVWTDWVIHFRANPFTSTTNASTISGGENFSYGGNRGILQIWKSVGGARTMTQVHNVNGAPFGLVPRSGYRLVLQPRIYKYGWRKNPTTVDGPVELGFDDIRFGCVNNAANGVGTSACVQRAIDNGDTGYADVNPAGTAAP